MCNGPRRPLILSLAANTKIERHQTAFDMEEHRDLEARVDEMSEALKRMELKVIGLKAELSKERALIEALWSNLREEKTDDHPTRADSVTSESGSNCSRAGDECTEELLERAQTLEAEPELPGSTELAQTQTRNMDCVQSTQPNPGRHNTFSPPLPWYSVPDEPFPPRASRGNRRRGPVRSSN